MKYKKTLSLILALVMVVSVMQSLLIVSSAAVNETGCVEEDWEQYLKVDLPIDSELQTYGEHTLIYADNGVSLPEKDRFYVYKIHTKLGNTASFIPQILEERIEKSYKEVMNEEINVTILSGYEEVLEKYRGIGDKSATYGDFILEIQRGVDKCEVEVEIVVHKDLSISAAGEAKWNEFLTTGYWYGDAEHSRYISRNRTLVTEENGVALPADQQYYTYSLYSSFSSVELFTKSQMHYRLNWTFNRVGGAGVIVDGYEQAYAKLSQMENGGSSTDTYKIRVGDYVAEIDITISVGTNFGSGNSFWEDMLEEMPMDSSESAWAEHTKITHDENGKLEEPITVHKLHITLGSSQNLNASKLESIISGLFYQYYVNIVQHVRPSVKMVSGVEEALQKYEKIGDGQAVTGTYKFIISPYFFSHTPSLNQRFEYGIECEIVIHKDLSIDEAARNTLSQNWTKYTQVSLTHNDNVRTYGESVRIEFKDGVLLDPKDRFYIYKIHTSFGRSSSFTKENLETLLEESYAKTMNQGVEIKVIDGFEQAKEQFSLEGDHGSVTQLFTLQIKGGGTGITESIEIVIHKNIGLELCLPGKLETFISEVTPLVLTCGENPSFNKNFVAKTIEDEYKYYLKDECKYQIEDKITVTVNDFEKAFAEYRNLADGASMDCSIFVTVQRNNNSYSVNIPFTIKKNLSNCTGYDKGVCPACGAMLGDVNEDGIIDDKDTSVMKAIIVGAVVPDEALFRLADINGDGVVNTRDSFLLAKMIAGMNIWE